MSVVNRMLQDIDHRIGSTAFDAQSPVPDVRGVPPRAVGRRRLPWLAGAAVVLVAAGALVALGRGEWRLSGRDDSGTERPRGAAAPVPAAVMQPLQPPAPAATPPVPAPAGPVPATGTVLAQGQQPAAEASPTTMPREPIESFKLSFDLSPLKSPAVPAVAVNAAKANKASGAVRPVAAAATAPPVAVRPVETAGTAPASPAAVRQVAAAETVASARVMWQEGSRNNAYATLREALAAAETSRDPQATRTLAFELARLELAGNRAQAALDLLRRQGVLLADDPDALALRGNAQQRLVLHGEAAESYLAALRLRPTEGKWMLGAAISLAADGRTEEAQAWANRARDRGAITPPIAAYLQQLGVGTRQ